MSAIGSGSITVQWGRRKHPEGAHDESGAITSPMCWPAKRCSQDPLSRWR